MPELQWTPDRLRSAFPLARRIGLFLGRLPKPVMVIAGYAILGVVALIDYWATPAHVTLLMYYLVPIFLLAWFVSPAQGVIIAVAGGAINLAIDLYLINVFPNSWDPLLNDFVAAGVYIVVARATSLLRAVVEFEQSLSRTDPGTGAANRRAYFERAEYELSRARRDHQPLTTVSLDLDNFKVVNDRWGHAAGDAALKAVVETLDRNTRDIDLVARLGGDEFALLLPETDLAGARLVIARLQGQLRRLMADNEWPVTFSIGAVTFAALPATTGEMLRRADELMYAAKNGGKDQAHFHLAG